jgi:hypothetical protein
MGLLTFDTRDVFGAGGATGAGFDRNGVAPAVGSLEWVLAQGVERAAGALEPPPAPTEDAPTEWEPWLERLFPHSVRAGFAPRHRRFWEWAWRITPTSDPEAFVGLWPRGGAKSSTAELGTVALGTRGKRRYALYVRDTQDRADDSVQNIAALLESASVARTYPEHAERSITKFGASKGWRRNRVRTAGGFTVDALGLDVAARGVKLEDQRPDLIIFDDVDGRLDSAETTKKKLTTITDSLLPAGTANCAVIFIQNLIIPNGVAAQLADGRATFLARRVVSGPEPAVLHLTTEKLPPDPATGVVRTVITGGTPTWAGQDLAACQSIIDRTSFGAFNRECQHNVREREGALWTVDLLNARRRATLPPGGLKRIVVAVDPSGGGAEIGIVAAGLGYDNRGYVLADRTAKGALGPAHWAHEAVALYHELLADVVAAEKNFGGDMVDFTLHVADPAVPVKLVNASRGKAIRAEPVSTLYTDGRVDHVGDFPELEAELTGWAPGDAWSPNRLDALVWALTELMIGDPPPEFDEPAGADPRRFAMVGHSAA